MNAEDGRDSELYDGGEVITLALSAHCNVTEKSIKPVCPLINLPSAWALCCVF